MFGSICRTPSHIRPVGYKWVFVRKRNEKNEIARYKARLVAQGFTQRLGIDYDETYSPVMGGIALRDLISLAVNLNLKMKLMDVVNAYLYGNLDTEIYIKYQRAFPSRTKTRRIEDYTVLNSRNHFMDSNNQEECGTTA